MRCHPLNPPFFKNVLAAAYLGNDNLQSAVSTAKQTITQAPADLPARFILTSALVRSGDEDNAHSVASEIRDLDPGFSVKRFAAMQTYRDQGVVERFASDLSAAGLPD